MAYMALGSTGVLWRVLTPAGTGTTKGQRRAFPRWKTSFPVLHGFGVPDMGCEASDVSDEGMAFQSRVPYPTGTKIIVEMQLPTGPIRVNAVVKHCGHGTVGVQFLNLSRADRLALSEFCYAQAECTSAAGSHAAND